MRDPILETYFQKHAYDYRYLDTVALMEINVAGSLRNQARAEGEVLIDWLVERYANRMAEGDEFPAIVGFDGAHGYELADGNHRVASAQKNGEVIFRHGLYILALTDPLVRDRITRSLNMREGLTMTKESAIAHAKRMVVEHGIPIHVIAAEYGLSVSTLQAALHADQAKWRLRQANVRPSALSTTNYDRLNGIQNDRALVAAHGLVDEAKLSSDDVSSLVTEVRKERSEDGQIEVVKRWAEKPEIQSRIHLSDRGTHRLPPSELDRQRLIRFVRELRALVERYQKPADIHIVAESDCHEFRSSWQELRIRMERFLVRCG